MTEPELITRIAELETQLITLNHTHEIDRALIAASPVDLESARAVARSQIKEGDDVGRAIQALKAAKPFLFTPAGNAPSPRSSPSVMTPASEPASARDTTQALADEARTTGDRRALLAYLRARKSR